MAFSALCHPESQELNTNVLMVPCRHGKGVPKQSNQALLTLCWCPRSPSSKAKRGSRESANMDQASSIAAYRDTYGTPLFPLVSPQGAALPTDVVSNINPQKPKTLKGSFVFVGAGFN